MRWWRRGWLWSLAIHAVIALLAFLAVVVHQRLPEPGAGTYPLGWSVVLPPAPAPAPAPEPTPATAEPTPPSAAPAASIEPAIESGPLTVPDPPAEPVVAAEPMATPGPAPAPEEPSAPTAAAEPASAPPTTGAAPSSPSSAAPAAIGTPEPLHREPPVYPRSARRRGVEGDVALSLTLASDGSVAGVVIAASSGHPDLDNAAIAAARRWRYPPPDAEHRIVQVRIAFRLQG